MNDRVLFMARRRLYNHEPVGAVRAPSKGEVASVGDVTDDFTAYVSARHAALTRTAYLLTGNHHEAQDLVQSALAKAYLNWHKVRESRAPDS